MKDEPKIGKERGYDNKPFTAHQGPDNAGFAPVETRQVPLCSTAACKFAPEGREDDRDVCPRYPWD
jgi:hypothetical protein